jgi:hypothetical protein
VLKDGEAHPLFEGAKKIRADFEHRSNYDIAIWRVDCNSFGADIHATRERLFTGQVSGEAAPCVRKHATRRERWLNRFFGADPRWRIRPDETLKLTEGDRVIRFRPRTSKQGSEGP